GAAAEMDYAELIRRAGQLLDDGDVVAGLRERYRAVFVDEYQDTDPAQERLLHQLAGGGRDLVVVGDPDQSIYAFRGADVQAILRFPDRFPTTAGSPSPVAALEVCRRFGPTLQSLSRTVAARLPAMPGAAGRAHRELHSPPETGRGRVDLRLFATTADEANAIADVLRRAHLEDGLAWGSMAVLVRSGKRSLPALRRALVAAGVPVTVASDEVPVARIRP